MMRARTRRIAVTGASGFIGGAVARAAMAAGHDVYAFGRRTVVEPAHVGGAPYRSWDITTGRLADPPNVDAIVHCAGSVTDWGRWTDMHAVNVHGTANVYDTFRGAGVEDTFDGPVAFVHVSTASVYAPWIPTVNAAEDSRPSTREHRDAYGRSKAAAEDYLFEGGRTAIVLRPHAVYGTGDTTLLPRLLNGIRPTPFGPKLFAVGDGRQRVSLTSIDNVAQACLLAADPDRRPGVYNIADAEPVILDDALRAVLRARGSAAVPVYLPYRLAYSIAAVGEAAARATRRRGGSGSALPKPPRLTRYAVRHLAYERTLDISAAREHLGYQPAPTSFAGAESW